MRCSVWLAALLLLAATSSLAQEAREVHPWLASKYSLDLGLFMPERQVELSVYGPIGSIQGQDIDFDERFGLKKRDDLFAMNFAWRFGEKWELGAQYFESTGQRSRTLDEDVEWGEFVFGAGTGVTAGIDFTLVRAFFGRNFDSAEHHDFGIGAGFHYLEIGAFIEGQATINGQDAGFRRESVNGKAPLPNVGAWYVRSLSKRWAVKLRADWFAAEVGDYDGELVNLAAGVNYQLFDHVGLGVSYNYFELDVGVDKRGWRGEVKTIYDGLFVHASVYW
ncbi:MAG: hypothetical protein QNI96_08935 [Woeseiaceae bacterium]|nr:hypothetical protein [Woeseiaceae bacterium]